MNSYYTESFNIYTWVLIVQPGFDKEANNADSSFSNCDVLTELKEKLSL